MKAKRTMSRFFCDNSSKDRGTITQRSCFTDTGFIIRSDDDRDSGTESDDEGAEIEELQKYMESIIHLDSNSDPHRRLKRQQVTAGEERGPPRHHRRRSPLDSALPSDSDPSLDPHSSEEELEGINGEGPPPEKRKWEEPPLFSRCCPVEFRTSPPAGAHKPSKCLRQGHIPPHELCSVLSPRKRHRRTPTAMQRPCLDFEKMQQVIRNRSHTH